MTTPAAVGLPTGARDSLPMRGNAVKKTNNPIDISLQIEKAPRVGLVERFIRRASIQADVFRSVMLKKTQEKTRTILCVLNVSSLATFRCACEKETFPSICEVGESDFKTQITKWFQSGEAGGTGWHIDAISSRTRSRELLPHGIYCRTASSGFADNVGGAFAAFDTIEYANALHCNSPVTPLSSYTPGAEGAAGVAFSRWGARSTWLALRQAASLAASRVNLFLTMASSS